MARSRVVKPEFWNDEKLAKLSRDSRLTFIGIWTCSDDYGVTKGNHAWLKAQIFPYEDYLKLSEFSKWLAELENIGRIIPFIANDEKYYYIKHFTDHQKIDHPSKFHNPEPPDELKNTLYNGTRETLAKLSRDLLYETETETELKLKESADAPFQIPNQEQITASSLPKVEQDIIKISDLLYKSKLFAKSHAFANKMLKEHKNPRAVLHTLTRCYARAKMQPFENDNVAPWAYCTKIMQVENGNFNERDHTKDSGKPS